MYDLLIWDPVFETMFTHDGFETREEAEYEVFLLLGTDYFGTGDLLDTSDVEIRFVG
jgi:hypothetical protein